MAKLLSGQVAIVTGASRGIGQAIAYSLAQAGAHVVLTARRQASLQSVHEQISENGGTCTALACDVQHESSINALFEHVQRELGRCDILINNAGVGIFGPLEKFSASDFDQIIATNLRGSFLCCRQAMKLMIPAKRGYIINIASVVGIKGYPLQAAYTASKHGIMGLTKSLAVEAQPHHIRVSVILPGGVDTDMVASARPDLDRSILLKPIDIADTVMFLLSLSENAAIDEIYIRRRSSTPF